MSLLYSKETLKEKASKYCASNATRLVREIGFGTQGVVYKTKRNTAIKVYALKEGYFRECAVYKRLEERGIQSIQGLKIPRIMNWDDDLTTFEMSIVHIPCILDFGGAYVDTAPEHLVRDEIWIKEKSEEFGENWDQAVSVIREIEGRADIYLADVNTGNIRFCTPHNF